jgi:CelD/BcsL family acetyltransferase involved in cellulose biosynthesis
MKAATAIVERSDSELRVDWIRDVAALASIEGEWRALESRVQHRTHVSTFDFLAAWYRHYAGEYGGAPLVGLAWRGTELAGIAPLTIRRGSVGRIPVTRVDFAPNDSIAGEFLVDDDHPEVVGALIDSLVHSRTKFDVICLNGFDPASQQLLVLRNAAARHRLAIQMEDHAFAVVDVRQGYKTYQAGLSSHYRRNLNQKARKIAATGFTVDGVQQTQGLETLEGCIPRMIAINEASYKLGGQRLADRHREFLTEVVRRFGARGLLSLPILSIGGKDAAFILGVVERGCFYDVTLAYDESFARLSPGAFLMQQALQHFAAAGVHTVISHGAHDYKKHWSTAFVPQKRVFLFAPGPRGAATRFVRFGLQPLWRRLGAQESSPEADRTGGGGYS